MRNCTIRVAKTKALINCAVTAQLICVFVFAYANYWFSHAAAQFSFSKKFEYCKSGNFRVTFILLIICFQIISEFLNLAIGH